MSIWYDVSGLYDWKGSFTGIQRVVYNLGQSLATGEQSARFFIFKHGSFREVGFTELEARLKELSKLQQAPASGPPALSLAKLHHYGMVAAKKVVLGSPVEKPLRKTYDGLRVARRKLSAPQAAVTPQMIFESGDTVVVVDGNWQFRGFAKAIAAARAKVGFRLVHFVHDIIAIRNPALANTGADKIIGDYFEEILLHSDKLLANSESTKRDIEWFMKDRGITKLPVDVVILGSDIQQAITITPEQPAAMAGVKNFIFAVSTIEVRKNYQLLYYTYKEAAKRGITLPRLIIMGRKGWMAEETYRLLTADPEIQDQITIVSGTDHELKWFYENCLFTVFPSFYEGWGLPVAEALLHGKCCVSSDTSSMPEVGGDLVRYVSPYDTNAMLQAIQELTDPKTRQKIEARIQAEFKPVTWQDSYESFVKALA